MLLNSSDFRVHRLEACAAVGWQPNSPSVTFKSTINESVNHALNIASCFGVGERLVGSRRLQTFGVLVKCISNLLQSAGNTLTVSLPSPWEAAAFPSRPKTESTSSLGLFCRSDVCTEVKNC